MFSIEKNYINEQDEVISILNQKLKNQINENNNLKELLNQKDTTIEELNNKIEHLHNENTILTQDFDDYRDKAQEEIDNLQSVIEKYQQRLSSGDKPVAQQIENLPDDNGISIDEGSDFVSITLDNDEITQLLNEGADLGDIVTLDELDDINELDDPDEDDPDEDDTDDTDDADDAEDTDNAEENFMEDITEEDISEEQTDDESFAEENNENLDELNVSEDIDFDEDSEQDDLEDEIIKLDDAEIEMISEIEIDDKQNDESDPNDDANIDKEPMNFENNIEYSNEYASNWTKIKTNLFNINELKNITKKKFTLVFSNLEGFPTIIEKIDSQYSGEIIKKWVQLHHYEADILNAMVDDIINTSIITLFGFSDDENKDRLSAFEYAFKISESMQNIFEDYNTVLNKQLNLHIGIHSGEILCQNIETNNTNYIVTMGENLALTYSIAYLNSKLNTNILASENSIIDIKDSIECVNKGSVNLKGRDEKIVLYEPIRML